MSVLGIYLLMALVLATLAAWVADLRGRNFWVYFAVCFVLPVAALISIPYLLAFGRHKRTAPAEGPGVTRLEQLERLVKLRDAGALTSEEFEAEKSRTLTG